MSEVDELATMKYIKALLVLGRIDFPKTHDIRRLVDMLPPDMRPDLTADEQNR
jgi:HEPN domain-containing protein